MKNTTLLMGIVAVATLLTPSSHAQERTAAGSLQNEASWSALKILVNKAQSDVNLNRVDINAIKNCAASGKLYASAGCRDAVITIPVDQRLNEIVKCGNQGKVYSESQGCIESGASDNRWVYHTAGPSSTSDNTPAPSTNNVKRALQNAGIGQCAANIEAKKCAPAGTQCYTMTTTNFERGGQSSRTVYTTTSNIYICN